MGGKHQKKLRAERSKVHLKKKKLSKGENLTSTTFTVKKILAVEQLRKVEKDEPVSNWNIPLKDLLTRLNHYNFTSRLNGLIGIKELVSKYPGVLGGPSLKLLMGRLLELITDEEHKIRVTAMELLSDVFALISDSSKMAFEKLLNLHLACAMTHRNASIQRDSLKFIDVMIKHSPDVVKYNFKSIMQNFIRIMKSYFYESYRGVFSHGKSNQDLEREKREMLARFYKFITVGYPTVPEVNHSYTQNNNIDVLMGQKMSLRGLRDEYKKMPDLTLFKNSEKKENVSCEFNGSEYKRLCSLVVPLLFDTWTEFSLLSRHEQSPECALTEGAGELLSVLLRVLLFVYDLAVRTEDAEVDNWFATNYGAAFKKVFTYNFPYLPVISMNTSKCNNISEFPEGFNVLVLQNLIICYLAYSLKVVDKNSKLETNIENYVAGSMAVAMKNQEAAEVLLKVVKAGMRASRHRPSNILGQVLHRVSHDAAGSPEFRRRLSKVLMDAALEENGSGRPNDEGIANWMKSLPRRLCQAQVFVEEVETVSKLITTPAGAEVLREIESKAEEILGNLHKVRIEGIARLEGQKMMANILYRCNGEVLMRITKKKNLDAIMGNTELKKYIADIFSQKLTNCLACCEA